MNDDNLKRYTSSEAREYGKKGAAKSAEVRRKKKAMRERAEALLSCKLKDPTLLENYRNAGLLSPKGSMDLADAILAAQIVQALTGKGGDPKAFKAILDLVEPDGISNAADENNAQMEALADLLQAPKQNRTLDDFEDGDSDG